MLLANKEKFGPHPTPASHTEEKTVKTPLKTSVALTTHTHHTPIGTQGIIISPNSFPCSFPGCSSPPCSPHFSFPTLAALHNHVIIPHSITLHHLNIPRCQERGLHFCSHEQHRINPQHFIHSCFTYFRRHCKCHHSPATRRVTNAELFASLLETQFN